MKKLCLLTSALVCLASAPLLASESDTGKYFNTVQVDFIDGGGTKVPMTYATKKSKNGAWRLRIPKEDMLSDTLETVEIRIPAARAKNGEEGYFITPSNAIGSFKLDSGAFTTSTLYMPIFGVKTPRATFIAIIKGLRFEWKFCVDIKDGNYDIFPRFNIKAIEFKPYEDIVIDFYELSGASADYVGMAKKYRQYQLGRGEVKPLKERVKTTPTLAMLAKSIVMRAKHGAKPIPRDKNGKRIIKDYTAETELPMQVIVTFDELTDYIKTLKKMGCHNLYFHLVGWNIRGHDGRYPQILPVEPAAGGEEALKRTIETAKSLGYYIQGHLNHTDAYRIADCWSEDYIAKKKDGSLLNVGCWAGGKAYTPCPKPLFERFIKSDYVMLRDRLGFNGMDHVDVLSAILPRVCHDPNHPLNRKQWAEEYLKIMKYGHEVSGGFSSESGYDHLIKYLDWAYYINWSPKVPKELDRYLPFWQLVYHGIVPTSAFYSDTNNNLNKDWREIRLHHAEFGGLPVYYVDWTHPQYLPKVKELYDEYQKMAPLQLEFMEDHRQLAPNVFLTVYGDGSKVVTNYSESPFAYDGKTVKAKDFLLIKSK